MWYFYRFCILKHKDQTMMKHIYTLTLILFLALQSIGQDYTFEDFTGTWHGYISSQAFQGYYDPMTMIIEPDGYYTESSGHLMPTIYPNTQECDFDEGTNRMHWWYLDIVYAGQYFYQHFFYEVVYFSNDTLEMHYNFWDDPEPYPEVGTIFLVRETSVGLGDNPQTNGPERKLVRVCDMMGRETDPETKGMILLYQYDDGTVEKKYNLPATR